MQEWAAEAYQEHRKEACVVETLRMRAVLLRPLRKSLGISIVEEDGDWSRIAHTITKDDWNEEASRGRDLVPDFTGEKTGFLSHLYIKVIFLPRQARDKRRENSKKARFVEVVDWFSNQTCRLDSLDALSRKLSWAIEAVCENGSSFEPYMHKCDLFTKTGSGQT
eukprot:COSAG06_NODE_342_length_17160_cov_11.393353_2_plen_165_part_00